VALPGQIATFRKQAAQAASGVKRLRIGLGEASAGALQLGNGAAQASAGAARLGTGARLVDSGASRLSGALGTAAHGMGRFAQGSQLAAQDASQLSSGTTAAQHGGEAILAGLQRLEAGLRQLQQADAQLAAALASGAGLIRESLTAPAAAADQQLAIAYSALQGMGAGRSDPQYASALAAVTSAKALIAGTDPQTGQSTAASLPLAIQQLTGQTQHAADSAQALSDSAARLLVGVRSAQTGMQALVSNLEEVELGQSAMSLGLSASTRTLMHARAQVGQLADGARRLASGTQQLSSGIGQLTAIDRIARGNDTLAHNLSKGNRSTAPLESGLRHTAHVIAGIPPLHGMLADGHLVLAGAASAGAAQSSQLSFVLDSAGAGRVARILVFPRTLPIDAAGARLRRLLTRQTATFAHSHGLDGALGGPATQLNNFRDAVLSFVPVLVLALCVLTYVFLVLILGTLILPAVAILLNLVIVAATFGLLTLLFQGNAPVLGGAGFVDAVTVAGVFTVLFALSIDYQVFLLTRMREAYEHGRDAEAAVLFGIRRTARVVTGAAFIMAAVFLSFGSSTFVIPRQFGVGLTIAVLLDAFVLRLFMLPAVMRLLGDRGWWMPAVLQRHIPRLKVEG
jgi:RND superfamily putative drug exporter